MAIFTQYWPLSLCSDANIGAILCPILANIVKLTCCTNIGPIFTANVGPLLVNNIGQYCRCVALPILGQYCANVGPILYTTCFTNNCPIFMANIGPYIACQQGCGRTLTEIFTRSFYVLQMVKYYYFRFATAIF